MNAYQKLSLIKRTAFLKDKLFHLLTPSLGIAYFDQNKYEKPLLSILVHSFLTFSGGVEMRHRTKVG